MLRKNWIKHHKLVKRQGVGGVSVWGLSVSLAINLRDKLASRLLSLGSSSTTSVTVNVVATLYQGGWVSCHLSVSVSVSLAGFI